MMKWMSGTGARVGVRGAVLPLVAILTAVLVSACGIGIDGGSTVPVGVAADRLSQIMMSRYASCGSYQSSNYMMCAVLPADGVLEKSVVSTGAVDSCASLLLIWPCPEISTLFAAALSCPITVVPFPSTGTDQPFQGTLLSGSQKALKLSCTHFH